MILGQFREYTLLCSAMASCEFIAVLLFISNRIIMTLEDQLQQLTQIGIIPNDGIQVDDFLVAAPRERYEKDGILFLLFILGNVVQEEPYDRPFCNQVWQLDINMVMRPDIYTCILNRLAVMAGRSDDYQNVRSHLDVEDGTATIEFDFEGSPKKWELEVFGDIVDAMTIGYIMEDMEADGRHFFYVDDDDPYLLLYITQEQADQIGNLISSRIAKFA